MKDFFGMSFGDLLLWTLGKIAEVELRGDNDIELIYMM